MTDNWQSSPLTPIPLAAGMQPSPLSPLPTGEGNVERAFGVMVRIEGSSVTEMVVDHFRSTK